MQHMARVGLETLGSAGEDVRDALGRRFGALATPGDELLQVQRRERDGWSARAIRTQLGERFGD
jgi:hypothetical protein